MTSNPLGRKSTRRDQITYVTNALEEAEFALESCERAPVLGRHQVVMQWLIPEARAVLADIRAGKDIPFSSARMLPVHALQIVATDIDYMLMDRLANTSQTGREKLMLEFFARMAEASEEHKK